MFRPFFVTALVAVSSAAHAGDKPVYAPAPDWVKPAPPIDMTKIKDESPIFLILDTQQRLKDGEVVVYAETASRAASAQMLDALGTVKLPWQPDKGDLIVHKAEIMRGAERIDLLAGKERFSVLRREEQLEQRMLNGALTATMAVEGLRVGDILHLSFSITQKDDALGGNVQAFALLPADPVRAEFGRARLIWPVAQDVKWKLSAVGPTPQIATVGGYRELTMSLPLDKQPEMPGDAPLRFRHAPVLEASSFADWQSVSRTMAPLYETKGLIASGSPLAGEVARIAAAERDPLKRAALALQLVQEKVRYLFKGMDGGNYVPQSPAQTWSVRYGDCKAKTLLLLAILRDLGVEAEPVLASMQAGDWVPERLPSAGAFDHVIVRATVGGESLWLDGTGSGTLLADIRDTPPFRHVLPLRTAGAGLTALPLRPSARAELRAVLERDESAGLNFPAPFTLTMTMRGQIAQMLQGVQAAAGKEQLTTFAKTISEPYVGSATIVARKLTFDAAAGTATLVASGVAYPGWDRENERYRATMDPAVTALSFEPDRSRAAWRDVPVATGNPEHTAIRLKVRLPAGGKGFALEGSTTLSETLAGLRIDRTTTLTDDFLVSDTEQFSTGAEIAVADIGAVRQKVAQAKQHVLRVVAPVDYPSTWQVVEQGKKTKAFESILTQYRAGIADQPDKAEPFTNRAWFLERIYDRKGAIEDLGRAIAIEPTIDSYLWRARLYRAIGDDAKAMADITAARKIEPGSAVASAALAELYLDTAQFDKALSLYDERISEGGKNKPDALSEKANALGRAGDTPGALALMDAAIGGAPGNPDLLNKRCWLKATLNIALDTALKDCTKALALEDSTDQVLDSRALVYYRLSQVDSAMEDLNAALEQTPDLAESLFLRGVIRKRQGNAAGAKLDLDAARLIDPMIYRTYERFGIVP